MTDQKTAVSGVRHGATRLPAVEVESYNVELKDDEGLLGDRANKGAFREILERWRKPLRKAGEDPFGGQAARSAGRSSICCWWRETPRRRASCMAQSRTSRKNSRS